ncbi:MAG: TetR/AcrR family transcriptional regulator [Streptomyces sp.]|uniref:TetR/AcrR family transcriptional regulator n=1 Tax=Streptomyces sp. TaxID=1931 RepID=UPI003D6BD90D
MPTAREALLAAAHTAVGTEPWTGVRMVDVAAAAGVSRQTLYNEFGSKEGLGSALVNRLVDGFLDAAARAAAEAGRRGGADPAARCAAVAASILRAARDEPLVHAALTGCWGPRMPLPSDAGTRQPGARTGDPGELATALCDRMVAGLCANGPANGSANGASGELSQACEAGLRIALSYIVAPSALRSEEEILGRISEVVRALLAHGH